MVVYHHSSGIGAKLLNTSTTRKTFVNSYQLKEQEGVHPDMLELKVDRCVQRNGSVYLSRFEAHGAKPNPYNL